jgi:hypothetical protein
MSAFYVYPHEDREAGAVLAAVITCFLVVLPGVSLKWLKSALKESVVYDVAFSVFAANDPVSWPYMAKSKISGYGLGFRALGGIYE